MTYTANANRTCAAGDNFPATADLSWFGAG